VFQFRSSSFWRYLRVTKQLHLSKHKHDKGKLISLLTAPGNAHFANALKMAVNDCAFLIVVHGKLNKIIKAIIPARNWRRFGVATSELHGFASNPLSLGKQNAK
jgi:hypothetical protein